MKNSPGIIKLEVEPVSEKPPGIKVRANDLVRKVDAKEVKRRVKKVEESSFATS